MTDDTTTSHYRISVANDGETSWNGKFAKKLTARFPWDNCPCRAAKALERLAWHILDKGRMTSRRMAEIMDCDVEDITKDV